MALIYNGNWMDGRLHSLHAANGVAESGARVAFVDYGKGICIILVVMMHSTLGVGEAMNGRGWLHYAVEFSRPFRMPDFFLIAGLFLARTIDSPWRRYIDRKVLHFVWFYILWTAIQLTVKAGSLSDASMTGLAKAFAFAMVEPDTTLWFIYLLPIFFLTTRLVREVPWPLVLVAGALLESLRLAGYGTVAGEFAARFIYFYAGYRFAPQLFAFAAWAAAQPFIATAGLALWLLANGVAVFGTSFNGVPLAEVRGLSLVFGFAGSLAVIAVAALLAEFRIARFLRWLGEQSLTVYLAFFLFMAALRIVLVRTGLVDDIGTVSLLVTLAGIAGPLALAALLRPTPLRYLFRRPNWARLPDKD